MIHCGPCGAPFPGWPELREHADGCAATNPWRAYGRAKTRREAREILYNYLGVRRPDPMSAEVRERLRNISRDPARKLRAEGRRAERRELIGAISRTAHQTRRRRSS